MSYRGSLPLQNGRVPPWWAGESAYENCHFYVDGGVLLFWQHQEVFWFFCSCLFLPKGTRDVFHACAVEKVLLHVLPFCKNYTLFRGHLMAVKGHVIREK